MTAYLVPIVLCLAVGLQVASCQDGELVPLNATSSSCLDQMVKWCDGMRYPKQGAGFSMISASYGNETSFFRVYCYSDSEGTNCTRNGQPWFACSRTDDQANNTFTYKGQVATPDGVDDEICATADKALDDLFVQNLSVDNESVQTALETSMVSFFQQMAEMQEQIEQIQRRMQLIFGGGLDPFGGVFYPDEYPLPAPGDNRTGSTNQTEPRDDKQAESSVVVATTGPTKTEREVE